MATPILIERVTSATIIGDRAAHYLEIVDDIIRGINPAEYKRIVHAIQRSRDIVGIIEAGVGITLTALADAYTLLAELEDHFAVIITMFENQHYSKLALYNRSSTYTMHIHRGGEGDSVIPLIHVLITPSRHHCSHAPQEGSEGAC